MQTFMFTKLFANFYKVHVFKKTHYVDTNRTVCNCTAKTEALIRKRFGNNSD